MVMRWFVEMVRFALDCVCSFVCASSHVQVCECLQEVETRLADGEYALAGTGPKRGMKALLVACLFVSFVSFHSLAGAPLSPRPNNNNATGSDPVSPKGAFVGKSSGSDQAGPRSMVSPRTGGGPPITGNIKKEALARQLRYWLANVLPQYADDLKGTEKSFGEVLKSGVIICEYEISLVGFVRFFLS
jgi:hypothetical protein